MELKIKIEISNAETDEVLWTDWALGTGRKAGEQRGMFESAEMILGKMESNLPMILERDYPEKEVENEDDTLGVGDEKEKLPPPEDDEIDAMVESESKEYMTAHG